MLFRSINAITDKVVTLEISKDVKIKVLRSSIAGRWNPDAEKTSDAVKTEAKA